MTDARALFTRITGHPPYDYQRALAERDHPPAVVEAPTGAGKTLAVLVPWLLSPGAPRRLVYALPMRSLVEQTAAVVRQALAACGREEVAVHVLMGGEEDVGWRERPEARMVLVGTIDMLLSRAIGRGYGESRFAWPVSFGLLNNDARWIFDEVQLMGPARTTSAQLAGLRAALGTARGCETIWMSATIDHDALLTADHPSLGEVVRLTEADRRGPLARRLDARKDVERLDLTAVPPKHADVQVAGAVVHRHRPGTRTLVVVNRVDAAQQLFREVAKASKGVDDAPSLVLLHSRFRPQDRAAQMRQALADPDTAGGTIVMATQVVEAGVDLSSALLVTETAPFSSMVQRLGRCNRAGELKHATVLWIDRGDPKDEKAAAPYEPEDLCSARAAFLTLDGESASPSRLESMTVPERRETTTALRRRDLLDLFDTAPDLSGADIDIAPFIRSDDERSVSVFFRDIGKASEQAAEQAPARRDELVTVPLGVLDKRDRRWAFDHVDGRWLPVRPGQRVAPGHTLMLAADDGGYGPEFGWTGKAKDVPTLLPPPDHVVDAEGIGFDPGSLNSSDWQTLGEHLGRAHDAARTLADALALDPDDGEMLARAGALHDIGKAHPLFQEMILGTIHDDEERAARAAAGTWAKSAHRGGRHVRPYFRHELVSALMLAQADRELLGPSTALLRYLVAAHHGRVRLSIRPAPEERPPTDAVRSGADVRFALGVVDGDAVPEVVTPLGTVSGGRLDLDEMELGGGGPDGSWSARALQLLDEHGPFRLAYMEALVRVADWRASG